jgi:GTP pyrophosphokinase
VEAHKDQRRKSGEAYIFHPIAVAKLSLLKLETTSIAAALLHDVVEDTPTTVKT